MGKFNKNYDDYEDYDYKKSPKKTNQKGKNQRKETQDFLSDFEIQKIKQRNKYNNKKKYKNREYDDYEY